VKGIVTTNVGPVSQSGYTKVLAYYSCSSMTFLDKCDVSRAPAESFDTNCSGAAEQVQYPGIDYPTSQDTEKRFFGPVGDGSGGIARHDFQFSPFGAARDYAHR
jgi:hypothetical protein